jgi:hypothetical protein
MTLRNFRAVFFTARIPRSIQGWLGEEVFCIALLTLTSMDVAKGASGLDREDSIWKVRVEIELSRCEFQVPLLVFRLFCSSSSHLRSWFTSPLHLPVSDLVSFIHLFEQVRLCHHQIDSIRPIPSSRNTANIHSILVSVSSYALTTPLASDHAEHQAVLWKHSTKDIRNGME